MRTRKHEVIYIVEAIQALESGESVGSICERFEISASTLYEWSSQYKGMNIESVSLFEGMRRDNAELKRKLKRCELERDVLVKAIQQQGASVSVRCAWVAWLIKNCHLSVSRACALLGVSRSLYLARSHQLKEKK
ncbi:TPA: helix-turn-helix domain-containing protein [Serratia marcescens]|nr:helix-turn-helix domain-containing protein [Serratia marcescens]